MLIRAVLDTIDDDSSSIQYSFFHTNFKRLISMDPDAVISCVVLLSAKNTFT